MLVSDSSLSDCKVINLGLNMTFTFFILLNKHFHFCKLTCLYFVDIVQTSHK